MTDTSKKTLLRKWTGAAGGIIFGLVASCAVVLAAINSIAEERELPRYPLSGLMGAARFSELRFKFALGGGKPFPGMIEQSRSAALTYPLSTDPFLFSALAYFPTNDSTGSPKAEPFLRELLRRDPRSRGAHILLLRRDLVERRIPAALFHLGRLKRLEPTLVGQLMQELGGRIQTDDDAQEVANALYLHPDLVDGIIVGVANGKTAPSVVARFASALPRTLLVTGSAAPALIDRLAKDGYVEEARGLWAQSNRLPSIDYQGPIYDPQFLQKKARPPFGWTYVENESGVSEWKSPGSVYIEYYGRQSGPLLTQTLALPPGMFRLSGRASLEASEVQSMALEVSCSAGTPILAQAPLSANSQSKIIPALDFRVPISCPSQVLTISGLPRESRVGGAITLHSLKVDRLGAGK